MSGDVDALWRQSVRAFERGALDVAQSTAEELVALSGDHAEAWRLLGVIAARRNDTARAVEHLRRAAALAPRSEDAVAALLEVLLHRREHADALSVAQHALARLPATPRLLHLTAAAAIGSGSPNDAEAAYRAILAQAPADADAANNLGTLLHARGKVSEAIALYRQALAVQPRHPDALNNLAATLISAQDYEAALPLLRRAVESAPRNAPALANLGLTEVELLEVDAGYAHLAAAAALQAGAAYKAALAIPPMFATRAAIDVFRAQLEDRVRALGERATPLADPAREYGRTPFYLAYHDRNDRDLMSAIARLFTSAAPELAFRAPHVDAWQPPRGRPIRLGVVSAFMHDHTIGRLFADVVAALPRERFEVELFAPDRRDDPITRRLDATIVRRSVLPPQLAAARRLVAERALDAVLYPELGMDPLTYFLAYARLAPVQVATWGHPVTSGLENIDAFVSHAACEPADAASHYRERLLLMPASTSCTRCPRPVLSGPARTREELGLPRDATLYLIAQTLYKMHPDFYDPLAAILRSDPGARVVFVGVRYAAWEGFVRAQLAPRGVERQAMFIGAVPRERFLNLLALGDVFLDTFHFGGGNTVAEAIAVGIPVVTLPGRFLRGRLALGWLRKVGVVQGVARDADDYVAIASRWGADRAEREAHRAALLAGAPAIFDDVAASQAFADLLERAITAPASIP